jgi:hypothetical protein
MQSDAGQLRTTQVKLSPIKSGGYREPHALFRKQSGVCLPRCLG